MFEIYPAVDIKGGRCVRLRQGQAEAETVYAEDPMEMAREWERQGARWLHVIDLDGAFAGQPQNSELIARLIRAVSIPVQVGGGLRTDADLKFLRDAGAARMILGTRACRDLSELKPLVDGYGDKLAAGIDARQGLVQVQGWTQTLSLKAVELAVRLDSCGFKTLIVTDTATDGMLQGPNLEKMAEIGKAVTCQVIASGGVASAGDVSALRALKRQNINGVIVGKALYEGRATLRDLLLAASKV